MIHPLFSLLKPSWAIKNLQTAGSILRTIKLFAHILLPEITSYKILRYIYYWNFFEKSTRFQNKLETNFPNLNCLTGVCTLKKGSLSLCFVHKDLILPYLIILASPFTL